eukprot:7395057-Karenia_brevis.AAC.1
MGCPKDLALVYRREWAMKRGMMGAMITARVSRRNGLPKRPDLLKEAGVGNKKGLDGSHDY